MDMPRRHRHRAEYCPSCDRKIGSTHPSSGGEKYLLIDHALAGVEWQPASSHWRIACTCGAVIPWTGAGIKWRHPRTKAA